MGVDEKGRSLMPSPFKNKADMKNRHESFGMEVRVLHAPL
jgi:hypothetical protein